MSSKRRVIGNRGKGEHRGLADRAEGQINRRDFGLTVTPMLDGKLVVGLDVKIMIELELVEQQEAPVAGTGASGGV